MKKKKYRDANIWEQQWYLDLMPEHKLAWDYFTDNCHQSGIIGIDIVELKRKTGIRNFDLTDFVGQVNKDYDKYSGDEVLKERIKIIMGGKKLWITGHLAFQWGKENVGISPAVAAVKGGLILLMNHGLLNEAIEKGFIHIAKGTESKLETLALKENYQLLITVVDSYQGSPTIREREREEFNLFKGESEERGKEKATREEQQENIGGWHIGNAKPNETNEDLTAGDEEIEGVKYFLGIFNINLDGSNEELRTCWRKWINRHHIRGEPIDKITATEQIKYLRTLGKTEEILKIVQKSLDNNWRGFNYGSAGKQNGSHFKRAARGEVTDEQLADGINKAFE